MAISPNKAISITKSQMEQKLVPDLINLIDSFLTQKESEQFYKTAHFIRQACKKHMERCARILLSHVFNADPDSVKKVFTNSWAKPEWLLTKTNFDEGFWQAMEDPEEDPEGDKEFVCVRHWQSVSPIQAAALSLDNFLVRELLRYLDKNDELLLKSKKQLEEIKSRMDIKQNNDDEPTEEKTDVQNKVILKKETIEKKQVYADGETYAAPLKALLEAYSNYVTQRPSLSSQKNGDELIDSLLWAKIGTCQKRLPRYVLQEFFKENWVLIGAINNEPKRGRLHYYDKYYREEGYDYEFNYYDIGEDTTDKVLCRNMEAQIFAEWRHGNVNIDHQVFNILYKLRESELSNIIDELQTPENALNKPVVTKP